MRKSEGREIERIYEGVHRLRAYCDAHPDPELEQIYHQIFGAVAVHALLALGEERKKQIVKARKPRARVGSGEKLTDQMLLDSYNDFLRRHGSIRGWIKAASIEFGLDRSTVSNRFEKCGLAAANQL